MEATLCSVNTARIFRLPLRATANQRYSAEKMGEQLWTGALRVMSGPNGCRLDFKDTSSPQETLFASCPVVPGSIEPVIDSSRFFVIRLVDPASGSFTFVGLGFDERSSAFDMQVAVQDHQRRVTPAVHTQAVHVDYRLKQGETIAIGLGSAPKTGKNANDADARPFMLPPPPSASKKSPVNQSQSSWTSFQ